MKSNKRRRTIEIKEGIVIALRQASIDKFDGKKTPTEIASMIFIGNTETVKSCEASGSKSVSMTEAMTLAIKCRADKIEKSIRSTANDILIGRLPPLSRDEVIEGNCLAEELELKRSIKNYSNVAASDSTRKSPSAESVIAPRMDEAETSESSEAHVVTGCKGDHVGDPPEESDECVQNMNSANEIIDLIEDKIPPGGIVYF